MKKVVLGTLLSFCFFILSAQSTWTWLQGDAFTPRYGRYGTKGVADTANRPGVRTGFATWKAASGDIWMFGGTGNSATGSGFLNDLWKYSPSTDTWTWISGDYIHDRPGVYGSKGISSPTNMIRSRSNPVSWMDAAGDLWLFGGETFKPLYIPVSFYTNDLWKYTVSTGQWTWMAGDTTYVASSVYLGIYGTKGVASAFNRPGSRHLAAGWMDITGNLWLFGGYGASSRNSGSNVGGLNDLWKYSMADGMWTWVSGDTIINQTGVYETKGVASPATKPGSKIGPTSWTDAAGNFWLFGGSNNNKYANDLWRFSPSVNRWTWISGDSSADQPGVYGTKGIAAAGNKPGARYAATSWTDTSGNFFVFAGSITTATSGAYNDLWKFSPSTSQWTWIWGDTVTGGQRAPVYGLKGVASDTTKPFFVFYGSGAWTDASNNLWLSNGDVLWKYAQSSGQWTWVRGDTSAVIASSLTYPGNYGTRGVPLPSNQPRARRFATTWTDASNQFWMYGGTVDAATFSGDYNYLNDLWKYDPSIRQWTWMNGDSVLNKQPVYGTQGMPSAANTPGVRRQAASWTDAGGNLWLFGGYQGVLFGTSKRYSDLWKYTPSTGQWTWIRGSNDTYGVYEKKGTSTAATYPGARYAATTWTDASGNLWLFGGDGYAGAKDPKPYVEADKGKLNDLWKFTPSTNRWMWVGGDTTTIIPFGHISQKGVYGTKGVASASNQPGGRSGSAGWIDPTGNLWLFGGVTNPGGTLRDGTLIEAYFNDLWKYDPSTGLWTWMSGGNTIGQTGLYGIQGTPGSNLTPGARRQAVSWTDGTGSLYLLGGNTDSTTDNFGIITRYTNDLWRYSTTTDQWTWLSGDSVFNQPGVYGNLNVPSSANKPGGRDGSIGWSDNRGNLWLFSGYGYPVSGYRFLNDVIKFSPSSSLPVLFSSFRAQKQLQSVVLYWTTAQEQNSRSFIVERSADGIVYSKIGTVAAAGTMSTPTSYGFTDLAPLQGNNFYRLKEVDLDDKFMYSPVAKIYVGEEAAGFMLVNNPVQHDVRVNMLLPTAQKVELQVRDAGGRLWVTRGYAGSKGSNLLRLPVDGLPQGTYFLQVVSPGMHGTRSFVKQ